MESYLTSLFSLLSTCKFTHNDMANRSQRQCVTSPNNIDLSAITSMLIPHSNSRSSRGICNGFHCRAETNGRNEVYFMLTVLYSDIQQITHYTAAKRNTRTSFQYAAKYVTHDRPLTQCTTTTLSTFLLVTTWLTPLGPLWTPLATHITFPDKDKLPRRKFVMILFHHNSR